MKYKKSLIQNKAVAMGMCAVGDAQGMHRAVCKGPMWEGAVVCMGADAPQCPQGSPGLLTSVIHSALPHIPPWNGPMQGRLWWDRAGCWLWGCSKPRSVLAVGSFFSSPFHPIGCIFIFQPYLHPPHFGFLSRSRHLLEQRNCA